MRIPRTHGRPPHWSGSTVILSVNSMEVEYSSPTQRALSPSGVTPCWPTRLGDDQRDVVLAAGTPLLVNPATSTTLAAFQAANANVARINSVGKGFFNRGTQPSGADVAESFAVDGN